MSSANRPCVRAPGRRRTLAAFALGLSVVAPGVASARSRALEVVTFGSEKVRIDGLLREWPAKLDALGEVVKGSGGGDPSGSGAIALDDKNVYVVMKVRDKKLVRTADFGEGEDHGVLELAFPAERGFRSVVVDLYAGVVGKSAGAVKIGGQKVKGARLVEAPSEGGYALEASIPWAAFPDAKRVRVGMRAALRYADSDSAGQVHTVIGTGTGSGASLTPLLTEQEQGVYRNLVRRHGLSETPSRFAAADLAGDGTLEAVAVYGGFLTVVGSKFREGKEFFFQDLGGGEPASVSKLEVRDFTGDGKADVFLVKRVGNKDKEKKDDWREMLQVLRFDKGDSPTVVFQHETGLATKEGEIKNEVVLKLEGDGVSITVQQGTSKGFEPDTYKELLPPNMEPALLPWQTVKSQTYTWNGSTFAEAGSESWKPSVEVAKKAAPKSAPAEGPPPPPPPRPPSPDELLDRVYALYRQDRKVGIEKPRFDFMTDVAADSRSERVLVHGKDVVVFGKGFKEGTSYAFTSIGVESSKDVVDATARDLTGDGKAEIIVRAVLHAKASKQLGGGVVDRHAFFVYQASEGGIKRIFAAETGRSVKDDQILASLRFVPEKKGTALELGPGRAVGWTEKTYPFPVDTTPYGGLEPLPVPWSEGSAKRYRFDGNAYVATP